MTIVKSIGKNTLGGGKRMNVNLKTYNRSTHDLSYLWRNTQAVGTLVPFMCELGLPGDTWDIDIRHQIMTHPTIGPLFGSFKFQADVFTCPIRLYNAMLHNNALKVGLDMKQVKLPKWSATVNQVDSSGDEDFRQINPSCVLSYLGIKGWGTVPVTGTTESTKKNITAYISYLDIFKNYYANKQEELFYQFSGCESVADETGIGKKNNLDIVVTSKNLQEDLDLFFFISDDIAEQYTGKAAKELKSSDIQNVANNFIVGLEAIESKEEAFYRVTSFVAGHPWVKASGSVKGIIKTGWITEIMDATGSSDGWSIFTIYNSNKGKLKKYNLTDIDNIRESILSYGRKEYVLNNDPQYKLINFGEREGRIFRGDQKPGFPWSDQGTALMKSTNPQSGLILKTYQSDVFTNWVNTEWLDGENGINKITAVKIDPESQSFQLDTFNLAKKVYDMLNRIAVSDGTYQSWIETVYTNEYIERSETPVYQGGMSCEIEFQQVISNSATSDEPLGTLAGRGTTSGQKGGHMIIKVDEPSYLIGICSITPRVDYCQGNRFDVYLDTLDDLRKPALDGIGFQDRLVRTMTWKADILGENQEKPSIGKQPAWIDYMTNFNKTQGNFAIRDNEAFMCLNRFFEFDRETGEGNFSTYIEPEHYNYIFADTELNAMNFWVQLGLNIECRRQGGGKMIPNL